MAWPLVPLMPVYRLEQATRMLPLPLWLSPRWEFLERISLTPPLPPPLGAASGVEALVVLTGRCQGLWKERGFSIDPFPGRLTF